MSRNSENEEELKYIDTSKDEQYWIVAMHRVGTGGVWSFLLYTVSQPL